MKTLTELIDVHDPGWAVVQEWLNAASNPYEVLAKDEGNAEQALLQLQVTTRSPLGALVYETGALLIDDGWLRILGSGSARLARDPMSWTQTATDAGSFAALLIADDASGGFFALNGGGLGEDIGNVYYFAPDALAWEGLEVGYSAFVEWALCGDLALFYQTVRWPNWREEVRTLGGEQVYAFFPFLWTEPTLSVNERKRTVTPIEEQWRLAQELAGSHPES